MRRFICGVVLVAVLGWGGGPDGGGRAVGQLRSRAPWPMFHANVRHTGLSRYVGTQNGTLKWRFQTPYQVTSSPAIGADGTVYVGAGDHYLYAINPRGTQKWRFQTGDVVHSSPAIGADRTVYVGSCHKYLYAINPDGTQKWSFQTQGPMNSSPAIGADGTVYVGSSDNYLYALKSGLRVLGAGDAATASGRV